MRTLYPVPSHDPAGRTESSRLLQGLVTYVPPVHIPKPLVGRVPADVIQHELGSRIIRIPVPDPIPVVHIPKSLKALEPYDIETRLRVSQVLQALTPTPPPGPPPPAILRPGLNSGLIKQGPPHEDFNKEPLDSYIIFYAPAPVRPFRILVQGQNAYSMLTVPVPQPPLIEVPPSKLLLPKTTIAGTQSIEPPSVVHTREFGAHTVSVNITLLPPSVVHDRAFGTAVVSHVIYPVSVVHTRAIGTPTIGRGAVNIAPGSIVHARAIGTATLTVGATNVSPPSVIHNRAFGTATVTGGIPAAPPQFQGSYRPGGGQEGQDDRDVFEL